MGYPSELGPDPEPSSAEHLRNLRARFTNLARAAIERGQFSEPHELHFDYGHYLAPSDYLVDYHKVQRASRIPEKSLAPTREIPFVMSANELSGAEGNKLYIVGHYDESARGSRFLSLAEDNLTV